MQETQVQSPGQEDPLKKKMATHSSILAWEIPWTEEPGRLQSMGSPRVRHNSATEHTRILYSTTMTKVQHEIPCSFPVMDPVPESFTIRDTSTTSSHIPPRRRRPVLSTLSGGGWALPSSWTPHTVPRLSPAAVCPHSWLQLLLFESKSKIRFPMY